MRMPDVAEVAVVAAPDARLGEIGCAYFRMQRRRAPRPTSTQVRAALERAGLARQKWPELIREVTEFPRTPSGKVQKFVLRQRLREELGSERRTGAVGRRAGARRQPVRVGSALHVLARVDGRRGDLGRVAAGVDQPALAAVRASRRRKHADYVEVRCRSRS